MSSGLGLYRARTPHGAGYGLLVLDRPRAGSETRVISQPVRYRYAVYDISTIYNIYIHANDKNHIRSSTGQSLSLIAASRSLGSHLLHELGAPRDYLDGVGCGMGGSVSRPVVSKNTDAQ